MRQEVFAKAALFLAVTGMIVVSVADVHGQGFGSRFKNLSWFGGESESVPAASSSATPRTATRVETRVATRTPAQESQPTFARSPLAPEPSVSMPAPTAPTGELPTAPRTEKWQFGSRIWTAMNSTREALTIKPREIPAPDPVSLRTPVGDVQAPVFVSAARVYEAQGKLRDAREYYEKALAADKKNLDALVGLARLKHREGDLVAATEMYQRALRMHPNSPVVLNDLGLCYARREMLQQAEQSIRQAIQQEPTSKLYRNNLALVLVEMNRNDEALQQLQEVHGGAIAHYNLAFLLREKGQPEAAVNQLRAALAADPRMEPARVMLAELSPPMPNTRQQMVQQPPQHGAPPRGALGAPSIPNQPRAPYDAPVVNQQPQRSVNQGQQLPASHRPQNPYAAPQNNSQPYNGANYGSPTDSTHRQPANVGPVRVRFENGQASDYRNGPQGSAPGSNYAPRNPAPVSPAPQYRPVSNPSVQGHSQPAYDTNYREAPLPDAVPSYLGGQQPQAAPVQNQPATGGNSRWSAQ